MRFLDAGESHGKGLTAIIEGMPSGLKLNIDKVNGELARRQKGYGRGGRMKIETDRVEILSGVRGGVTLGSPITLFIKNADYENWRDFMDAGEIKYGREVTAVRPGHADLPGCIKYGAQDARNILERASARETAIRVAVGAVAKQFLSALGIEIGSHIYNIGGVKSAYGIYSVEQLKRADENEVRCMDESASCDMKKRIDEAKANKDTLGGEVEVVVEGVPVGVGSHAHYDRKLDYALSGAVASVQSVKSVSIGLGEEYADKFGSEVHDQIEKVDGKVTRKTNNAGGIEGGISNGEPIVVRATLKPIPTVMKGLKTIDIVTGESVLSAPERSDICAVPAGAVVIESVVAFTLAQKITETFGGDTISELLERIAKRR